MGSVLAPRRSSRLPLWVSTIGGALLLLSLLALLPSLASAYLPTADGRWLWQNPQPQGNRLADVCFVDETHGWAVGEGGTILVSKDGGQTWKSQSSGTSRDLNVVCFLDETHGWAAGEWEYVLVTRDGGKSWNRQHKAVQKEGVNYIGELYAMSFPDAENGWIIGDEKTLMHTTDGGRHWQTAHFDVSPGPFPSFMYQLKLIDFVTAECGWAYAGGYLYQTVDGGATWEKVESPRSGAVTMDFIDEQHGWAGCNGWIEKGADESRGYIPRSSTEIRATADGGRTWTWQYSTFEIDEQDPPWITDLVFLDEQHGWALAQNGSEQFLLRTTDGGTSWQSQPLEGDTTLSQLCVLDVQHSWAIESYQDSYAGVAQSSDGGATWSPSSAATFRTLTAVEALGAKQAVAVGEHGAIVATADGSTWQARQSPTTVDLAGLSFPDADHGWAVGDEGTIIASGDGGASWQLQSSPTQLDLTDVSFAHATQGWAVGLEGTIIHTSDGLTWTAQESGLPSTVTLSCVFFLDAQRGWAAGHEPNVVQRWVTYLVVTDDGGATWRRQVSKGRFGRWWSLWFVAPSEGWAMGGISGGIRHTSDAGLRWDDTRGIHTDSEPTSVCFVGQRDGWVAAREGRLATTHNGGETWTVENTGFTRDLLDVDFFDEGHGWAVGEGGAIIAYPDPVPLAPQSSKVRRGNIATLRYKVGASRSARVDVKIRIRNKSGKVVRILTQRNRRPNSTQTVRFRCRLPRGGYRFYVSAVDSAGRHQLRQGANKLTVMRR